MTLVENLEAFGIDPSVFAHEVQVGVACSSSVVPHPQKGQGNNVQVQGNQVTFISKLLFGECFTLCGIVRGRSIFIGGVGTGAKGDRTHTFLAKIIIELELFSFSAIIKG